MARLSREKFQGALLGLACGDAVGATVEFRPRGTFAPVTDMVGGGPFGLPPGYWTDDTSMALCLADSLIACRGMDLRDQMERYVSWYRRGVWSSKGYCFDIGGATREALERYEKTGEPRAGSRDAHKAGNGSIMRLAPVAMAYAGRPGELAVRCEESSWTTHGAEECLRGCRELGVWIGRALRGEMERCELAELAAKPSEAIRGTGYVKESLEAALWSFAGTASFEEAVLRAANLGDDADTTAAICGQIAGAYYGVAGIPVAWRERCYRAGEILERADGLYALAEDLAESE